MAVDIAQTLKNVRCFLLDMDGTIYLGNRLLEGSIDFLDAVVRSNRDYLFLTNNSSRSVKHYVDKLSRLGIPVPAEKIISSGQACAGYLNREHPGKSIYLLGNDSLLEEMQSAKIPIDPHSPEMVVIGYDTTLTYKKLCEVCDFVRAGLPYIATHPDYNCPTETGFEPDIGAVIAFIEASTGRLPEYIVGKPYREIVRASEERTGLPVSNMAMCGDRLYTDIKTGVDHGMASILVFTGETTRADAEASPIKPSIAVEKLADLIPYL